MLYIKKLEIKCGDRGDKCEYCPQVPLKVKASELQKLFSLHDHKRRLKGLKLLESMYLLAPTVEVAFSAGVALSFLHPRITHLIFPVLAPYDLNCVGAP
jgi:hypothetical protein